MTTIISSQEDTTKLKPGWQMVRFGDVVRNIQVNVDPEESGLERYVAGEHMETDNLHIKSWGTIGDGYLGPAFHRKFVKGQVLYGSRRTYLRKVALADFDGICANTTFVLEANEDKLLQDLLPFIMQTETFTQHAIKQSRGSVNPYVNWKDIAWYEFALPPKDEQRRIADILWRVERTINEFQAAQDKLKIASSLICEKLLVQGLSTFTNNLRDEYQNNSWAKVPLGDLLLNVQYGTSVCSGSYIEASVPVLRIPNVVTGTLDLSNLSWAVLTEKEQERFLIKNGDILIVRTNGNPKYVGRSVIVSNPPQKAVYASYLIRLRVDETKVQPEFVNVLLNSEYLRATLKHEIRSSAGNYNLNTEGIKKQLIPLPTIPEQNHILSSLSFFKSSQLELNQHLEQLAELKKTLLNQLIMV